jgi:hypothetical protein
MGAEYLLVTRRLPAKKFFQLRETSVTILPLTSSHIYGILQYERNHHSRRSHHSPAVVHVYYRETCNIFTNLSVTP